MGTARSGLQKKQACYNSRDRKEVVEMRWMDKMRYRFARMMYGRYGIDQLGRSLSTLVLVMLVVSLFWRNWIFTGVTFALLIWMYMRIFSKRFDWRRKENEWYLRCTRPLRRMVSDFYLKLRDGRRYRYYHCPNCGQRLRVPKGRGNITVTCPKCRTRFDARS